MKWIVKSENGFVNEYQDGELKHSVRASAVVALSRAPRFDTVRDSGWDGPITYVGVNGGTLHYHADPADILSLVQSARSPRGD